MFVEGLESGILGEESLEGELLTGEELVGMGAKSGQIPTMVFDLGSDLAHQIHEVLLDHPDHVEAVCYDLCIREVPADEGAIGVAQIHADDADVFFAFECGEVGVKILRITTFDDVENPVGSQVAESGGELGSAPVAGPLSLDGVFIDAEDGRADAVGAFSGFDLGVFVIEAFDGGGTEFFIAGNDTSSDAVSMLFVDRATEGFGGMPVGFDAGEKREEGFAAPPALVAVSVDLEMRVSTEDVEVTHGADVWPLAVDLQSPGLATLLRGSFQSTARAVRASCRLPFQMQDRVIPMLLDVLDLIPCDSDFFELY